MKLFAELDSLLYDEKILYGDQDMRSVAKSDCSTLPDLYNTSPSNIVGNLKVKITGPRIKVRAQESTWIFCYC